MQKTHHQGFTLIELSIVLVIIGLVVGGVLVGQSLIAAAGMRATITQIEKFDTAANTFREKYGYLPGDIKDPDASSFGFAARGQYAGEGDGNGVLAGVYGNYPSAAGGGSNFGAGENLMFWVDLSAAHMIDQTFNNASSNVVTTVSAANVPLYFPAAKIGQSNYIYAYGAEFFGSSAYNDGHNYFGLSTVSGITGTYYTLGTGPGLTVQQAYAIDQKMDDGFPQGGRVTASYPIPVTGYNYWIGTSNYSNHPFTTATPGSATTCFDNSSAASGTPGVGGQPQHYSLEISNGSNLNCALTFKMQAGD